MALDMRELLILDELDRNTHISQRDLADRVGLSVGLLHRRLREMIDHGYVRVVRRDVRPFAYRLTVVGKRRRRRLRYDHYRSVLGSFFDIESRISGKLQELKKKGATRVVFYGAGEVMGVTHLLAMALGLEVIGVVDDDPSKHGTSENGLTVQGPGVISTLEPDAVLITTFRHAQTIQRRIDPALRSSLLVLDL